MTVGVFFGGMSCEHDISIITGIQILNIAKINYEVIPIYVDSKGVWWTGKKYYDIANFGDKASLKGHKVFLKPGDNCLYSKRGKPKAKLDAALVCCHGLNGEDGTLQGLLQLSHIPYSGSGVLASAVSMDKITMKKIFQACDLAIVPFVGVDRDRFDYERDQTLDCIQDSLEYPLIIKPSNLGSSIGITVAHDRDTLVKSLKAAFAFDNRVIVEKALVDFVELNCAVLGGAESATICSEIEQPAKFEEFLSYDNKYKDNRKNSITKKMPADIDEDTRKTVQDMAKSVFELVGCSGVARCDFMVHDGKVYINEINTVPGSLSRYLFEYKNQIRSQALVDYLIVIAQAEQNKRNKLKYAYDSDVLQNIVGIAKK